MPEYQTSETSRYAFLYQHSILSREKGLSTICLVNAPKLRKMFAYAQKSSCSDRFVLVKDC